MELKPPDNVSPATQQHPLLIQFILLLFLIMVSAGFGSGLVQLLGSWWAMDYLSIVSKLITDSPVAEKNYIRGCLGISQLFTFTVPALLFILILSKKDRWLQLKLNQRPQFSALILGGLFIVLLFPVAQWIYWLNQQIPLPAWAIQQEDLINGVAY